MGKIQIAQAEANRAHAQAATPEEASDAYRKVYQETLDRFERARDILAAGLVSPNGRDGQYYVESQGGNGRYLVRVGRVGEPLCNCHDFKRRGFRCKHVLAAELHEEAQRSGPRPMTGNLMLGRKLYHECGHPLWVAVERRGDEYSTVYSDAYQPGLIEHCPNCGERMREADLSEKPKPQVRKVKTSGGTVTLEGGRVVNAWCRTCKSGGLPGEFNGRLECWCGMVIAQAAEVA